MKDIETINRRIDFLTAELSRVRNKDLRSIMTTERDALDWAVTQIEVVIDKEVANIKPVIYDKAYDECLEWSLT
jgi:hypothetical protein